MQHGSTYRLAKNTTPFGQKLAPLRGVLSYILPYKAGLCGVLFALFVTSFSVLALGKGLGYLIDHGLAESNPAILNRALLIMLGMVAVLALGTYARFYLITYVGEHVVADIRRNVYRHLLTLSPAFFETTKTGEILSRLTSDTSLLQMVVGSSLSVALRNTVMLIGGTVLLVLSSPKLAMLVALIVPLVVFPLVFLGRKVRVLSRISQDKVAALSAHAEESLNGIRTVQAFTREPLENTLFTDYVGDAFQTAIRRARLRAMLVAVVILTIFGAVATVLWVGGHDVLNGRMTPGNLSSFLFYSVVVAAATGAISEVLTDLFRAAGAAERLLELLATPSLINDPPVPLLLPSPIKGGIELDNIIFHYPTRPDHPSLSHFSLSIRPGETVALVGPSGAGKSTVFSLLLRFYDPQSGSITIDGMDIRTLSLANLRSSFGLVSQDPVIFSASALDNIRFAKPDATEDEVIAAAQAAAAMEFIEKLPEGLSTFLGEKGVRLSGGQRQRIAIARAILKNPSILLLDEATSALDSENEILVQEALERLMIGRTTLIIAHRLSTVQKADRIIVMENGAVLETGTHQTLLRQAGLYSHLASLQFTPDK